MLRLTHKPAGVHLGVRQPRPCYRLVRIKQGPGPFDDAYAGRYGMVRDGARPDALGRLPVLVISLAPHYLAADCLADATPEDAA